MQYAGVLRVGVNWAFAKFVNFAEFVLDIYLYEYKRKFPEHNKIWTGTPQNAQHGCGRLFQFPSGKTMGLFTMVPIMPAQQGKMLYIRNEKKWNN